MQPTPKKIVLDGNAFHDMEGFYDEAIKKLTDHTHGIGHNLDALEDMLRGGFGVFDDEPITIVWEHSKKSQKELPQFEKLCEIIRDHATITLQLEDESPRSPEQILFQDTGWLAPLNYALSVVVLVTLCSCFLLLIIFGRGNSIQLYALGGIALCLFFGWRWYGIGKDIRAKRTEPVRITTQGFYNVPNSGDSAPWENIQKVQLYRLYSTMRSHIEAPARPQLRITYKDGTEVRAELVTLPAGALSMRLLAARLRETAHAHRVGLEICYEVTNVSLRGPQVYRRVIPY